jgi:hypothetical protein
MAAYDGVLVTYRYLRLSMVTVLVLLVSAVVVEWLQTGTDCWQESISAYYYTPVQAVLSAAMLSLGASMIVLKGSTRTEDLLLTLGGMLAPVVGLVPAPEAGTCRSATYVSRDIPANVANNMTAVFVAGGLGLLTTLLIAARARRLGPGLAVAAGVWAVGLVWFVAARGLFLDFAHYTAAFGLFATMVGIVVSNSRGLRRSRVRAGVAPRRRDLTNRYAAIAVAMVAATAVLGLLTWLADWRHGPLWIEGVLIGLFALFWLIQTWDLWDQGLRSESGSEGSGPEVGRRGTDRPDRGPARRVRDHP